MFTILRPTLLVLFFLLTCVAKVFALAIYVYEVDASGNRIANPAVHCGGDIVRYQVNSDSDKNTRTRIDVTGGDVVEYSYPNAAPSNGAAGTSERVSSHEVVMGFHTPPESHAAYFKVQWYTNLYQQSASIRAVIYEKDFNIGWTETSTESSFPQNLFLTNTMPSASQGTYTICGNNAATVRVFATGATSYTWTTDKPGAQINGAGTYYPTTTTSGTIQVTLPSNYFANNDFVTITVKATGSCGTSTPSTTVYVQQSCSTNSSPNVQFVKSPNSTTCQPRYNVRTGTVSTATSYTATLHGGPYEGYSKTIQADPYAYYMDFPFDIAGPFNGISASVTVTSPGGTSAPTYSATQNLAGGSGAGCRPAQTLAATSGDQVTQSVYPNPATDQVTITGIEQDAQVVFYNALGACVKRATLTKNTSELTINLLDLSAGIYQMNVVSNGKVLRTSKLVVQH